MKTVSAQRGFTMIEVLVSVVVLSVGLLGIAGLQATGQASNQSAYLRSQATSLAYDMVDRIRANTTGLKNGSYNAIDTTNNNYANPGCGQSPACGTPAQIAQYDMWDWQTQLAQQLPSGNGTVTGAGAGSVFTVTIMWDDNRNGSSSKTCGSGSLKCFSVSSRL